MLTDRDLPDEHPELGRLFAFDFLFGKPVQSFRPLPWYCLIKEKIRFADREIALHQQAVVIGQSRLSQRLVEQVIIALLFIGFDD